LHIGHFADFLRLRQRACGQREDRKRQEFANALGLV
jgi:hypothetical protein